MLNKTSKTTLILFILLLSVLLNSVNVFAAVSKPRGRSDGPYPYKNMFGVKVGTYSYYNSEQCRQMAKSLEFQGKAYSNTGTALASYGTNLTWQGETVCVIMWGRSLVYSGVSSKLNDAASRNGAIIYTTAFNILTGIELQ